MYVKNEQLENVLIHSYVSEIIKEFSSSQVPQVSEDDAKVALSNLRSSSISIMKENNLEIQQEEKYDNDVLNKNSAVLYDNGKTVNENDPFNGW